MALSPTGILATQHQDLYTHQQVTRLMHNTQADRREMAIRFNVLRQAVKPVAVLYDGLPVDQLFSPSGVVALPRDILLDLHTAYGIACEIDTRRYPSVYGRTYRYDLQ